MARWRKFKSTCWKAGLDVSLLAAASERRLLTSSARSPRIASSTASSKAEGRFSERPGTRPKDAAEYVEPLSSKVLMSPSPDSHSLTVLMSWFKARLRVNGFGLTRDTKYLSCVHEVGIFLSNFFVILTKPFLLTSPYH